MWAAMFGVLFLAGGSFGIGATIRMLSIVEASILPGTLELLPSQTVRFDDAGVYVLYVQPPQFMGPTYRTRIGLWDDVAQAYVTSNRPLQKGRNVGGRFAKEIFHVPRAGGYRLVIDGLDESKRPYQQQIVFGRYVSDRTLLWTLAAVAGYLTCLMAIIAGMMVLAG